MISLAEGSVCVASAFTIATGKHIGDCDPVPSTSQLRAHQPPALEAGDARSTASIKRVAGSTLSVPCVLFVHKK